MDIVVLAGGQCPAEIEEHTGVTNRAMLPIGDTTMGERVLEAVCPFGNVIVVGQMQAKTDIVVVAPGNTFMESLRSGLGKVTTDQFLLVTADLPYLSSDAVQDFIARSDLSALINYPIIRAEECEASYPGMKRTTLRLREGRFTGGNIAIINSAMMRNALPRLDQAYQYRKSPLRLAGLIGISTLFRLILGQIAPKTLPISALEHAVSRSLGGRVRAIQSAYPEIGADVDTLEQYLSIVKP